MLPEALLNTELTRCPNELIAAIEANETMIRRRAYSVRSWPFSSCHSVTKRFFIGLHPFRTKKSFWETMPLGPPFAVAEPEELLRTYTLYCSPHVLFAMVLRYGITNLLFTFFSYILQQFPSGRAHVAFLGVWELLRVDSAGRIHHDKMRRDGCATRDSTAIFGQLLGLAPETLLT